MIDRYVEILKQLQPGDSFFIPDDRPPKAAIARWRFNFVRRLRREPLGWEFTAAAAVKNGVAGVRVWRRLADPSATRRLEAKRLNEQARAILSEPSPVPIITPEARRLIAAKEARAL